MGTSHWPRLRVIGLLPRPSGLGSSSLGLGESLLRVRTARGDALPSTCRETLKAEHLLTCISQCLPPPPPQDMNQAWSCGLDHFTGEKWHLTKFSPAPHFDPSPSKPTPPQVSARQQIRPDCVLVTHNEKLTNRLRA